VTDPFAPPPEDSAPSRYLPPQYPQYTPTPGYQPTGYQPQNYPPPPTPYGYSFPETRPGHGKAIAGMVLGIVALVFCWTSVIDTVFLVLGFVFSIMGLSEARKGAGGRGQALAGLWCTIVAAIATAVFTIIYIVIVFNSVNDCANQYGVGTSQYETCVNN
jgi:hypothetical protein